MDFAQLGVEPSLKRAEEGGYCGTDANTGKVHWGDCPRA